MTQPNFSRFFSILCLTLFISCGDENLPDSFISPDPDIEDTFELIRLNGTSQKGPLLIGSNIVLFETNSDITFSGRSFPSEIINDLGSFEIEKITLKSPFVEIQAEGFYFNEVRNINSESQLNLSAVAKLDSVSTVNVNILSSLEKRRVKHLINDGESFEEAKSQALREVLNIFQIEDIISESTELDISKAGNNNAILLAISIIIQGYQSTADISQLISTISLDIETDGVLENPDACNQLATNASFLDLPEIRKNIEDFYVSRGITNSIIPQFEIYIENFLENSPCLSRSGITYPENGHNGANILHIPTTSLTSGKYSLHAILEEGSSLRVRISGGNNWFFRSFQTDTGWEYGNFDPLNDARIFTATRTGSLDFELQLGPAGSPTGPVFPDIKVEYFENGDLIPTRTKFIVNTTIAPSIFYPISGIHGENILDGHLQMADQNNGEPFFASLRAYVPTGLSLSIKLSGDVWQLADPVINESWSYSDLDPIDNSRIFSSTTSGYHDCKILLIPPCSINFDDMLTIDYFINGSITSNRTEVEHILGSLVVTNYPPVGSQGRNILSDISSPFNEGTYSMRVISETGGAKIVLEGEGWTIVDSGFGWDIMPYDDIEKTQSFISNSDIADLPIRLTPINNQPNEILVNYFDKCVDMVVSTSTITVEP